MIILPSNSSGEYEVANSLRFNDGSSDYLSRTPSSESNRKTFTLSTWFKRTTLDIEQKILDSRDNVDLTSIDTGSNTIRIVDFNGGIANWGIKTLSVLRDVSAWYHIVIAFDTTQSTASDRIKIYVNGVEQSTEKASAGYPAQYPDQNEDSKINKTYGHGIGATNSGANPFDGYMAETVFIDGQALTPTSFGEFDEDTGIWKPIDVSDLTFGTNGFYLDFENSSSLGADVSGNGNNFTVNNLTSIDQTTDTCTNNFATMNPLDNYYQNSTFSNGNLKITTDAVKENYGTSTFGISQGKWYWEVKITASGSNRDFVGIADKVAEASDFTPYSGNSKVRSYYGFTGVSVEGSTGTAYGDTFTTGDIISVAVDLDNHKLYFAKNGTWQNSGDPTSGATGTGALSIDQNPASGFYYAQFSNIHNTSSTFEINFGNPTFSISSGNSDGNGHGNFEYAVPSGYYALNTKNLAEYG